MTSITFVHTSDFQLGMTRHFFSPPAQSRYDDGRREAVLRLGELAREEGAEFILVAGDVFEHNSLSRAVLNNAKEMFRGLPVPVYLLPGNHDPLVADSVFYRASAENVHVIAGSEPFAVAPGVELVGAPYLSKHANRDLVREALEPLSPSDGVRIAVGHGQVDSRAAEPDPDLIDLSFVEQQIAAGVIDYLALGDTHSTMSLGTTGRVWFSGSPETTDFKNVPAGTGESDSGNALVVRLSDDEIDVAKHKIGRWRFEAIDEEINSQDDIDRFFERLAQYPDKSRTAIKYGLSGTVSLQERRALEVGLEEFETLFASLRARERTMDLHLAPREEELSQLGLTGYAAAALADLVTHLDEEVARDATNLLFRLSGGGEEFSRVKEA